MDDDDTLGFRRGERETLEGALDWYRAVVERKLDDLDPDGSRRTMTPTGLSLLGVVKHLGWVERGWFQDIFAGEPVESIDSESGNSAEFLLDPSDTAESVIRFYRTEVARSRQIAEGASLDDLSETSPLFGGRVSFRWILVHMLEETARHVGHLDIMREAIDGRTGD